MRRKTHPPKPSIAPKVAAPNKSFLSVYALTRAAEDHGWRGEDAFFAGMVLHVSGVSVSQAEALFRDAARRVQ